MTPAFSNMLVGQRAVTAGVGVDLGAVQRHRPHLRHPRLAIPPSYAWRNLGPAFDLPRQLQHLDKQRLDPRQEAFAERRDRVVVGMLVGGDEAEGFRGSGLVRIVAAILTLDAAWC